mmetsp:Transcript_41208/g.97717  ORF Transcript_41208/g.97717 Transcript_41208/m.97717 type:complete len:103 (-) Transcript_41208:99-407(-)
MVDFTAIDALLAWTNLLAPTAHPLLAFVDDLDLTVLDNLPYPLPFDIVQTPPLSPQPQGPVEDMDMDDMDIETESVDTPPPSPPTSPVWGEEVWDGAYWPVA